MGTFRDPAALLAAQRRRAAAALLSAARQAEDAAKAGLEDFRGQTAGRLSSERLKKMNHPYGRGPSAKANYARAGNALMRGRAPRLPINLQSGRLRSSARLVRSGRSRFDLHVGGGVAYARYVLHPAGTRLMVGRGLMGWRDVDRRNPAGYLERRHRLRTKAWRDALRAAHRSV